MSELHWTGAVVLLSIAVLGDSSARARPEPALDGPEFAWLRRSAADEPVPPSPSDVECSCWRDSPAAMANPDTGDRHHGC